MNYTAEIKVKEDVDNVYKCIVPENITRERSSLILKKSDNELLISIEAKDAVALRATINAVTQVLAVYSKMKEIK